MIESQQFGENTLQATIEKKIRSKKEINNSWSALVIRAILCALLVLFPWCNGGVYYWTQFWVALGLLVCVMLWWYDVSREPEKTLTVPYIAILLLAGLLLGLFQLIPLPGVLHSLLGRQLEIYQQFTGSPSTAAMISLFPQGTWHQLQYLMMVLTGLLIGARYFRGPKDVIILLSVILISGCLLTAVAMIQKLMGVDIIPFTRDRQYAHFASYINRNNAAGYLLMTVACGVGLLPLVMSMRSSNGPEPLISREMPYWRQLSQFLTYQLAELNATKIAVFFGIILTSSGVIASLSRGGSLALLVGLVFTAVSYGLCRRPRAMSILVAPMVALILALTGWVGFSEKLFERWENTEMTDLSKLDVRVEHWKTTFPAVQEMGALGSGLGSYRQVHRLYTKGNETVIFEYAENQYFQFLVESGLPGLILFLLGWGIAFYYAFLLLNRAKSDLMVGIGTMGLFLLSSQAVASFFDFGLLIPANMFNMGVLVGILGYRAHTLAQKLKKNHWMNLRIPKIVVQACQVLLFAGLTFTTIDLYRHQAIAREINSFQSYKWTPESPNLAQTDQSIRQLENLVRRCPSIEGLNYLGNLWIHRFRLMTYQGLINQPDYINSMAVASEREQNLLAEESWNSTKPERVLNYVQYLNRQVSGMQARSFIRQPAFTENIPPALQIFTYSRSRAPLQPYVQMRIGQLNGLKNFPVDNQQDGADIERAIELAPANTDFRITGGIYFVQNGDFERAKPHFRRFIELDPTPNNLKSLIQVLNGNSGYNFNPIPSSQILDELLPDNPWVLYEFASKWCGSDEETRKRALDRAESLIPQLEGPQLTRLGLTADIQVAKGETEKSIETMKSILMANPLDDRTRFRLARILMAEQQLTEALEHSETLVRSNRTNTSYTDLRRQIESEIKKKADAETSKNF